MRGVEEAGLPFKNEEFHSKQQYYLIEDEESVPVISVVMFEAVKPN